MLSKYTQKYNSTVLSDKRISLTDYGTDLFKNGFTNLSVLRTKGISEGITVDVEDLILDSEVKDWIQRLAYFLKFLYSNFVEKTEVKATINLEL